MIVTSLEEISKKRYKVFLDEEFQFVLYSGELKKYHISCGQPVEQELVDLILYDVLLPRGKNRALHILKSRDRSEYELRSKLKMGYYPEEIIDQVIIFLKEYGYVDDLRFTSMYVSYYGQKKSKRQLTQELYGKGISKEIMEEVLEKQEVNEEEILREIVEKKCRNLDMHNVKNRNKVYQFCQRKGFNSCLIQSILKEF